MRDRTDESAGGWDSMGVGVAIGTKDSFFRWPTHP
jgi:hypothetical protein